MQFKYCKKCEELYRSDKHFGCPKCGEVKIDTSKVSPFYKPLNISVFKTYTTIDFDGQERNVTSSRDESLLCDRFGVIRHEEFENTYGKNYRYEDRNSKIDKSGIAVESKNAEECNV